VTDLFTAIMVRYNAAALSGSLTGLYNTQAPQDAVSPYCVFQLISDDADWTFSENVENCLLQFNLFSDESSPAEICTLFDLLKDAFDFHELTIDNYETIYMVRENSNLTRIEDVWQYNTTYRILLGEL